MSIIDTTSAPGVIDYEMLMAAMIEQGPQDEAGRIAKEEGQLLEEVEKLRLEFLDILRIDHLWPLTSLTSLCLSNNVIERIENLHMLANLQELNLSFNRIETMENLNGLTRLEVLLLFQNCITRLENMDALTHLKIFSIGNNFIEGNDNVLYLRRFPVLHSLNMAGNPCAKEDGFSQYIAAFLPNLRYYEYKLISAQERKEASTHHSFALGKIEMEEFKERQLQEEEETRRKELEWHTSMFVEGLGTSEFFHNLFKDDHEGNILIKLGEETEQSYQEYRTQVVRTTQELFRIGLEQHEARQDEICQFTECVDDAKKRSTMKCSNLAEDFLKEKAAIFVEMKEVARAVEAGEEMDEGRPVEMMQKLGDHFTELSDTTWYALVRTERILSEQLEEVLGQFERNLNDLANGFIEQAQASFVELRGFARSFNDHLAEIASQFLAAQGTDMDDDIPAELRALAESREAMTNALEGSLETHMLVIDDRDDLLRARVQDWAKNYISSLRKAEIQRSRTRMAEINHFTEVQMGEYDELINRVSATDDLFGEMYG